MPGTSRRAQRARRFTLLLLLLAAGGQPLFAQSREVPPAHATLRGWEERVRLAIFDRGGSYFGRTSDRGILQRFNEEMDLEYHIDLISYSFSLSETYDWYRHDNGVRYWTGSIDHRRLIWQGDLAISVPLGESSAAQLLLTHQETLEAKRALVRLGLRRQLFDGRGHAFLQGTLKADKPEADLELGFTWSTGPAELTVAVAALDVFSDFIYQTLEIGASIADTALDYTTHPYTVRVALELSPGRRFRAEAYALAMSPTTVRAESQTTPNEGFTQDERYAYAGGLLEWSPSPRTAVGGFASWVRARLARSPLQFGRPEDDFELTERTSQLGLYSIHHISSRFSVEALLAGVWRSEDRLRPDTSAAPNVDYADRAWAGSTTLTYRAASGFRGDLSLDFLVRKIIEPDSVPGGDVLDRDNFRLRLGLGWQSESGTQFTFGSSVDLDDGRERGFDGAYSRFVLYW